MKEWWPRPLVPISQWEASVDYPAVIKSEDAAADWERKQLKVKRK